MTTQNRNTADAEHENPHVRRMMREIWNIRWVQERAWPDGGRDKTPLALRQRLAWNLAMIGMQAAKVDESYRRAHPGIAWSELETWREKGLEAGKEVNWRWVLKQCGRTVDHKWAEEGATPVFTLLEQLEAECPMPPRTKAWLDEADEPPEILQLRRNLGFDHAEVVQWAERHRIRRLTMHGSVLERDHSDHDRLQLVARWDNREALTKHSDKAEEEMEKMFSEEVWLASVPSDFEVKHPEMKRKEPDKVAVIYERP